MSKELIDKRWFEWSRELYIQTIVRSVCDATQTVAKYCKRYLYPRLGQADPEGHLLAQEDVGVVGLVKECLQLVQLLRAEGGSVPALPSPSEHVLRQQLTRQRRQEGASHRTNTLVSPNPTTLFQLTRCTCTCLSCLSTFTNLTVKNPSWLTVIFQNFNFH